MPAAVVVEPAIMEAPIQPAEILESPEEPTSSSRTRNSRTGLMKPLIVLALPGMYLFYKYNQYRREHRETTRKKSTEKELQHLHHKIDKLLTKLDENEPEMASSQEDECVICVNAKATMQTVPCGHRVVCRRCFVKTIQIAVSQRLLPLRCVICRAKILRLKQTVLPRDYSISGKSWAIPQSSSEYNVRSSMGIHRSRSRWSSGNVPASASLSSMASGSSSISGVSSVSSTTCSSVSSASSSGSSSYGKSSKLKQSNNSFKLSQPLSSKARVYDCQNAIQKVPEEENSQERRLPPMKEFQRDFRAGKASTRIRCAEKILNQLETTPDRTIASSSSSTSGISSSTSGISTASSSSATTSTTGTKTGTVTGTKPKVLTVAQQVQKERKEREREKERLKAEKKLKKIEEKAEKQRQKEAKKLAKEEKKKAKKEAKLRKKEAKQALLQNVK